MADEPATTPQPDSGLVAWDDQNFEPEQRQYDSDGIRFFIMGKQFPDNPFKGRLFQLGGIERIAIFEEKPFHCWSHRFSKQYMGSGVNGVRRCTLGERGHCVACQHYESAPEIVKDGRKQKDAHCAKRKQLFGVNILVYKTDIEGQLLDADNNRILLDKEKGPVLENGQPADLVYEVYLWRFSADKFADVRQLKKDWGSLLEHDFSTVLSETKPDNFQDFATSIMPDSAWRSYAAGGEEGKKKAKEVVEYYKASKYNVEAILGKLYTDEEMLHFLNLGGSNGQQSPQQAAQQAPAEDVAAQIEAEIKNVTEGTEAPPSPPADPQPPAETPTPASTDLSDFDELLKAE